jgi:hypothetical protein
MLQRMKTHTEGRACYSYDLEVCPRKEMFDKHAYTNIEDKRTADGAGIAASAGVGAPPLHSSLNDAKLDGTHLSGEHIDLVTENEREVDKHIKMFKQVYRSLSEYKQRRK